MNHRPINKTKKSNRRCANCQYWDGYGFGWTSNCINPESKWCDNKRQYFHCCRNFEWSSRKDYIGE